jgi:tetratricopeptide (TPR) repeat protein
VDDRKRGWEIELNTTFRRAATVAIVLVASGLLFYQTWWVFLAAWITRDPIPDPVVYEGAILYDPDNAGYHFTLGQIYNYSTQHFDVAGAREHYLAAARLNPDRSSHWLELSKFHEQEGEPERSREAMERALSVDPNYAQTHWSAANLYIRLGDLEAADQELMRTADLDAEFMPQVLDLAWRFYEDPAFIVETHVPGKREANLEALDYFVAQEIEPGAVLVWERLEDEETTPRQRLGYVEFLVNAGKPHEAYAVFGNGMDPEDLEGVYNGDFETEPISGGFDWQYTSTRNEEVRWVTSEARSGLASLRIDFHGERNVNYGRVNHRLAVVPGRRYELSYAIRTEGLTTDQGVYVEVEGERSEAVTGTTYWLDIRLGFTASSELALVRVRRDPSDKLDNRIRGSVWIDDVSLIELAD